MMTMSKNIHKGYGAILGDMVGVPYELAPIYTKDFNFFNEKNHWSDDTILTIATMDALLNNIPYTIAYKYWGNKYYGDYYGAGFKEWLKREDWTSNDSFGNGAAMRISPIGYVMEDPYSLSDEAYKSITSSHDNDQAIKGGRVIATCINALNRGVKKEDLETYGKIQYGKLYPETLVKFDKFKVSCNYTVPVAMKCFYDTNNVADTIRLAISLGGDCDTIGSMAAELQVAYKRGISTKLADYVEQNIPKDMLYVLKQFNEVF